MSFRKMERRERVADSDEDERRGGGRGDRAIEAEREEKN